MAADSYASASLKLDHFRVYNLHDVVVDVTVGLEGQFDESFRKHRLTTIAGRADVQDQMGPFGEVGTLMSKTVMSKTICCLAALGAVLFLLVPVGPAAACVGPPPEPVCGKNLTLALAGPTTTLLTGGGIVDVSALVYLRLLDFPAGLGACPAGPYTVDIAVTATCTSAPDGSGLVLGAVVAPGFNVVSVPVTIPSGPARRCTLDATATVQLLDGMTLEETAQNVTCVVDAAGSKPRLGLELLGPPGSEIAREHPGDQAAHTYRITNNDEAESFLGGFTADMQNEARMPTASGAMPPGTGVFSISDPVAGDHFALGFAEDLFKGCLQLPDDPLNPAVPEIWQPVDLAPGESIDVTVFSRPWGMCADGSCGRSTVTVEGDFSDMSSGLACSGFVVAADSGTPPSYGWPDAGEVGEVPEPDDPGEPKVSLAGEPSPGRPITVDVEALTALLEADGASAGTPTVFSGRLDAERGRLQLQFPGPFASDAVFDFASEILLTVPTLDEGLVGESVFVINGPSGFESRAPTARVLAQIQDAASNDAFFDIVYQVSAVGIEPLGGRRPIEWDDVRFIRRADGSGFDVALGGGLLTGGTGTGLLAVEVEMDLRGFLSPEPQLDIIFEDGFESGDVSRWSQSVP